MNLILLHYYLVSQKKMTYCEASNVTCGDVIFFILSLRTPESNPLCPPYLANKADSDSESEQMPLSVSTPVVTTITLKALLDTRL